MATTRDALRTTLRNRLGEATADVWSDSELDDFLDDAIEGLYPSFYQREVETTLATAGPLQTMPTGCRNLHYVGLKRPTSNRVRNIRNWKEGNGEAYIPKTDIDNPAHTIVWAWTQGWDAPSTGSESISVPTDAQEVIILRAAITALEAVLTSRVKSEKYHAIMVRPGVTEEDVVTTMEALHASLNDRLERVIPLPEVQQ